ncbi:LysE family translocator [Streptomyces sp. NPDC088350]|uniref:LysE family translocator n=1 Tax=Streptomyces sp. NPDC088350 TaxID=3365854 RepID=UPI00381F8963
MTASMLMAFLAVDLLLVFSPGADWAYAISAGLRGRSVVPAVAGLVAGYAGYTLLAVAGLVVIVASSATLLTVLTALGAAYLMWLGWTVLRSPVTLGTSTEAMATSRRRIMLKGAGISGLNPKALLLYFSLFPQFIDPAAGLPVAVQTGMLGVLHMALCAVVYLAVGMFSRTVLQSRPTAARAVTRVSGVMMMVIGGFLLVERLAG